MKKKKIIKNLNKFNLDKVTSMAEVTFPVNTIKDIDGGWNDINFSRRIGFKVGALTVLRLLGRGDIIDEQVQ